MLQLVLFLGLCAIGFVALVAVVQFLIDLIRDYYGENKN